MLAPRLAMLLAAPAWLAGCGSFSGSDGSGPAADAGAPDATVGGKLDGGVDAAGGDAGQLTSCGANQKALFCDDFETSALDMNWSNQDLTLGLAEIVDGTKVGRTGKVLRFAVTKEGAVGETGLHLRHLVGAEIPVRVAFDLRMEQWTPVPTASSFEAGGAINGGLYTWLAINSTSNDLTFLEYTADTAFAHKAALGAGLLAPVNRWEHYEIVVKPGPTTHFELGVGSPVVSRVSEDVMVAFPGAPSYSPTYVEIGLTRANAGPMPSVVAYYDNVVVTSP